MQRDRTKRRRRHEHVPIRNESNFRDVRSGDSSSTAVAGLVRLPALACTGGTITIDQDKRTARYEVGSQIELPPRTYDLPPLVYALPLHELKPGACHKFIALFGKQLVNVTAQVRQLERVNIKSVTLSSGGGMSLEALILCHNSSRALYCLVDYEAIARKDRCRRQKYSKHW